MLSADRNHGFLALVVGAEVCRMALNDRIAQFRGPRRRCVLGEVRVDCGDGSVLDVLRGGEMRLAYAQVHDIHALLAQFVSLGNHSHSGGGLNASNAFGKFCDGYCFTHWGHTYFPDLIFLPSFTAGSNFSFNFCSTISGTNPSTVPPNFAISRTSRELR